VSGGFSNFGSGPGSFDANDPYRPASRGPGGPRRRNSTGMIIAIVAGIGVVGVSATLRLPSGEVIDLLPHN
jgi:hypothetical protein